MVLRLSSSQYRIQLGRTVFLPPPFLDFGVYERENEIQPKHSLCVNIPRTMKDFARVLSSSVALHPSAQNH
jgi:hypothetical protein